MRTPALFILAVFTILAVACKDDEVSERFKYLTTPVWTTDSLLADGVDASGPGMILEKFKGTAKFNADGTGHFGVYPGNWQFAYNETQIMISSDSIAIPLVAIIDELNAKSLKILTGYPNPLNPITSINIRMTFKAE
ncbi:MAG: hypothetical protein U0T82_01580 [Bacteroidales bacterium]